MSQHFFKLGFCSFRQTAIAASVGMAVVAIVAIGAGPASAQSSRALFAPAGSTTSDMRADQLEKLKTNPTSATVDVVGVDIGALSSDKVDLQLPGVGLATADKFKTFVRGDNDYTWVGDFKTGGGKAILVVKDGDITGLVENGLNKYQIVPLGGGSHAVVKINDSGFPPDHPTVGWPPAPKSNGNDAPSAPKPSAQDSPPTTTTADGVQVDVLVAYTTAAKNAYGGNMASLAQLAVDSANTAYTQSNANTSLRLVGTREVNYSESGQTFDSLLNALMTSSNSEMAAVRAMRESTGADLVGMMIGLSNSCGLAADIASSAANAYMVMYYDCVSNYSFQHEYGHLFGARHDPFVDNSTTPYAYGHGYITPSNAWRTIMAYVNGCGSCPRLNFFSNPSNTYNGAVTGTSSTHDNARVHRERVGTVAAFKSPPGPSSYSISVSANPSNGGTVTGGGTYAAGASVTVNATANATYAFSSWTENNTVVSWDPLYTFTASANRNLVAYFGQVTVPAAPTATSATGVGNTSFVANWNASGGASGYNIDVARDAGFGDMVYFNMGVGNVTSASIAGLTGGTTYYYRVRASNSVGTSGNSNTIAAATTLSAPSAVAATDVRGTSFTANWGAVSGASSYNIDISNSPIFATLVYANMGVGATTSASITGLSPSTTYFYRVRAQGSASTSANSNTVSVATTAPWLLVSPTTNPVALGPKGGPFNPQSFSYQLRAEAGAVNWSLGGLADWLTASAISGPAGTSPTTVTFSINTNAAGKAIGKYGPTSLTFINTTNGLGNTTLSAGLTVSPAACEAVTKGPEFGGDGKTDLLWRHDSGAVAVWTMNGAATSGGFGLGSVPSEWRLIGTADFNNDGRSDLLWRNTTTGQIVIWFVSGVASTGSSNLGAMPLDWRIVGAADFNGDGHSDILWRNDNGAVAIWFLINGVPQSGQGVATIPNDWRLTTIADFNGDGKADVLWRNSSGALTMWLMNGATVPAQANLGTVPLDWQIYGGADFNGDGKADILWRNATGSMVMWLMNGLSPLAGPSVGNVSIDWHIAGTGDFNADGKADILWRHDNGTVAFWLMNGASLTGSGGASGTGYDWHLVNGEHDRPAIAINPGPC